MGEGEFVPPFVHICMSLQIQPSQNCPRLALGKPHARRQRTDRPSDPGSLLGKHYLQGKKHQQTPGLGPA